jgi:hypothetical protein
MKVRDGNVYREENLIELEELVVERFNNKDRILSDNMYRGSSQGPPGLMCMSRPD